MRISLPTEKILEVLQHGAEGTAGLLDVLTYGYSTSRKKLRRYQSQPFRFKTDWADAHRETQKFYSLLYQLKKQGLIEKKKQNRGSLWSIKAAGVEKLSEIRKAKPFSVSAIAYREEPDDLKIIAFDIPSKEGRKRYWLRAALMRLGFTMLQKSVWSGKKKIPADFLMDLKERNMVDCVHIFAVSRSGSLREVK